eukprot:tig00000076_g2309.t1
MESMGLSEGPRGSRASPPPAGPHASACSPAQPWHVHVAPRPPGFSPSPGVQGSAGPHPPLPPPPLTLSPALALEALGVPPAADASAPAAGSKKRVPQPDQSDSDSEYPPRREEPRRARSGRGRPAPTGRPIIVAGLIGTQADAYSPCVALPPTRPPRDPSTQGSRRKKAAAGVRAPERASPRPIAIACGGGGVPSVSELPSRHPVPTSPVPAGVGPAPGGGEGPPPRARPASPSFLMPAPEPGPWPLVGGHPAPFGQPPLAGTFFCQ